VHEKWPACQAHDLSGGGDVLDRVARCAQAAVTAYDGGAAAALQLINVSENATFLVTQPQQPLSVLRVHRAGYHTQQEVASELAWMDALRREAGLSTPPALAAADGRTIVLAADPKTGERRMCVRFRLMPGTEPPDGSAADFAALGEITARMHQHARRWQPPAWFTRFRWDFGAAFGQQARWGRWQQAIGVGPAEHAVLGRLEAVMAGRLASYGTGPDRFGLIHADTRLANLLVDDGSITVIDFDDCGFGWFLYDAGTSVSFFEDRPEVPDLIASWVTGYRRVAELPGCDEAEIRTFIMYRRLLLLAWIGTHQGAAIAAELGPSFAAGTCDLAEAYLHWAG
jgi:Ser/Thr protein kinase RdoA (MazF antagonist)